MNYELTQREIDLISEAINCEMNHYKGLLLLLEFQTDEQKQKERALRAALAELEALQEKTTYIGQDKKFKIKPEKRKN